MDAKTIVFLLVVISLGCGQNDCGRSFIASGKIVGGRQVLPGMLPWQVALMRRHLVLRHLTLHCGGSIISQEFILTAAHCTDSVQPNSVVAVVGEYNLEENDSTEQFIPVVEFIMHEDYRNFENDIALVRTSRSIIYNAYVQPICLPDPGTVSEGVGVVSGWGRKSEGGDLSPFLQAVAVPIISDMDCQSFYSPSQITQANICAGVPEGGRDSCQGDSGGPLVLQNAKGLFYQAGIVSWGTGCARPLNPGVYTEVVYYLDWISSRINAYRQYQLNLARFMEMSRFWKWF